MNFIYPGSLSKGYHDAFSKRAHCPDILWRKSRLPLKDNGNPFDPKNWPLQLSTVMTLKMNKFKVASLET